MGGSLVTISVSGFDPEIPFEVTSDFGNCKVMSFSKFEIKCRTPRLEHEASFTLCLN